MYTWHLDEAVDLISAVPQIGLLALIGTNQYMYIGPGFEFQ